MKLSRLSNLIHNVLNGSIALLGGLEFFDWNAFFEPGTSVKVAGALALAKILINVARDGYRGLYAEQPVIKP